MTSQPSRRGAPEPPDPLPIPVVDNHTHLDISRDGDEVSVDDLGPVLAAARAVGVDRVVPRRRLEDAFLALVGDNSRGSGDR